MRIDYRLARHAGLALLALILTFKPLQAEPPGVIPTNPVPILITTGNTFQVLFQSVGIGGARRSLTIQNNNATDACILLIGGPWVAGDTTASTRTVNGASFTAAKAGIALPAGQSYTRYYPYVPADQILATCTTTADSLYADNQ